MNAIGLVELTSIAKGYEISDAMIKAASVKLLEVLPICPGKFMVLVGGEVADITSSVQVGRAEAGSFLVDSLIIPRIHPQIFKALNATNTFSPVNAVGILETFTIASGIISADCAVKAAEVELMEVRLSRGQGGKAYYSITGDVGAVKAALEAGKKGIEGAGTLVHSVVIPRPHPDLVSFLY